MEKGEMNMAGFWDKPLQNLLQLLQATPAGLTAGKAKRRLSLYGPNSLVQELHSAGLLAYLRFFANPLVVILLVDSGLSLGLRDYRSSLPALRFRNSQPFSPSGRSRIYLGKLRRFDIDFIFAELC